MRFGIFSDIHANAPALKAVLEDMENRGVERFICLGDLVGYGCYPNEVIDMVKKKADLVILGNHDNVALERESDSHFNSFARKAIHWTSKELRDDTRTFLEELPYIGEEDGFYFVHASPRSPADWGYVTSLDDAVDTFDFFSHRVCFVGHTHCPILVVQDDRYSFRVLEESKICLGIDQRLLVNVGSVGQPRDRDPRASWCLADSSEMSFEICRVDYDIEATQLDMRRAGFSDFLIDRLSEGR